MATLDYLTHDRREWEVLALLHGFIGIGAVAGGIGLAGGGSGIPERFLEGTIFSSYVIPGIALGALVGSTSILAAVAVWRRSKWELKASALASAVLIGWFAVQLTTVGYISWMQPFFIAWLVAQVGVALHVWWSSDRR